MAVTSTSLPSGRCISEQRQVDFGLVGARRAQYIFVNTGCPGNLGNRLHFYMSELFRYRLDAPFLYLLLKCLTADLNIFMSYYAGDVDIQPFGVPLDMPHLPEYPAVGRSDAFNCPGRAVGVVFDVIGSPAVKVDILRGYLAVLCKPGYQVVGGIKNLPSPFDIGTVKTSPAVLRQATATCLTPRGCTSRDWWRPIMLYVRVGEFSSGSIIFP